MIWIVLSIGLVFAAGIFFLDRKMTVERKRKFSTEYRAYQLQYSNYLEEDTAWREERARILALPWLELRTACEAKTGKPCECPTKFEAAQRIQGVMPLPPSYPTDWTEWIL